MELYEKILFSKILFFRNLIIKSVINYLTFKNSYIQKLNLQNIHIENKLCFCYVNIILI